MQSLCSCLCLVSALAVGTLASQVSSWKPVAYTVLWYFELKKFNLSQCICRRRLLCLTCGVVKGCRISVPCSYKLNIYHVFDWSARDWPRRWQSSWFVLALRFLSNFQEEVGECGLLNPFHKGKEDTSEETSAYAWHMVWKWSKSNSSILQCWRRCFHFLRGAAAQNQICFLKLSLPSGQHIWPASLICCQSPTAPRKESPSLNLRLLPFPNNRFPKACSWARWETWNKWMQNCFEDTVLCKC